MKKKTSKIILNTLEEKLELQKVLDHVADKPLFQKKIHEIRESLKNVKLGADIAAINVR